MERIRRTLSRREAMTALASLPLAGCGRPRASAGSTRLVFKHQTLPGTPNALAPILDRFARDNPDVEVVEQLLPNASETLHQTYLTSLEGHAGSFDVFVGDVIWVAELTRAGWVADLSEAFPPEALRRDFVPSAAEACIRDGRTRAVPWFVDVGLLYYRTDLVPRAPATYAELDAFAREAQARAPGLYGYLFQGRQYEGLVCNGYEVVWGHGGRSEENGRVVVDTPEARAGLAWLRATVERGLAPRAVTTMGEEEARRVFQAGGAAFMRNWPYAWNEAQRAGSPVRGRVGVASLPAIAGLEGHGALGGWQLLVNADCTGDKLRAAERLVAALTSLEGNLVLGIDCGLNPARRDAYDSPELRERAPFTASILPLLDRALPRPLTPYYPMISDVLQGELSAIVAGVRPPSVALARAQALVDHLTEARAG